MITTTISSEPTPLTSVCPPHFPIQRFFQSVVDPLLWILLDSYHANDVCQIYTNDEPEVETASLSMRGIYTSRNKIVGNAVQLADVIDIPRIRAYTHYLHCPKRITMGRIGQQSLHFVRWLDGPDMCILFSRCVTWTQLKDKIDVL